MRVFHRYSKREIDYLSSICVGRPRTRIKEMFNSKFGTNVTEGSIRSVMNRKGLKSGMQGKFSDSTQFGKGQDPWNKGVKGLYLGGEAGWFKEGDKHHGELPLGSESVKEGEVWIKTEQPNVWDRKHLHIWREEHGDIPDGRVIRFKDGNKTNVTLSNLFMTSRRATTSVVMRGLDISEPGLKVTTHRIAELEMMVRDVANE